METPEDQYLSHHLQLNGRYPTFQCLKPNIEHLWVHFQKFLRPHLRKQAENWRFKHICI